MCCQGYKVLNITPVGNRVSESSFMPELHMKLSACNERSLNYSRQDYGLYLNEGGGYSLFIIYGQICCER